MKKIIVIAVAVGIGLLLAQAVRAETPAAYGPEGKRFGIGVYLGEPTGFTGKGFITERLAIDGIVAWSFVDSQFTMIGDATYEFVDIPIHSNVISLPFYAGAGGKVGISNNSNQTRVGIRIPIGVAAQWKNYPVEAFAELSPGVDVAPSTSFDMTGGVGARFYF
jgi:hypothetical protein